jgi:hypothetical protein
MGTIDTFFGISLGHLLALIRWLQFIFWGFCGSDGLSGFSMIDILISSLDCGFDDDQ